MLEKLARRLGQFARDVRVLGLQFAIAGTWAFFFRKGETIINVGPFGAMRIRRGELDAGVIRQVLSNGEYDVSTVPHVKAALQRRYAEILAAGEEPVIIDAGANIGAAALWFRHQFPQATIVAIEPDRAMFAC